MKQKQVFNRTIMKEKHKQHRKPGKEYIDCAQRAQLSRELGDSATVLYHHYFDKAAYRNFDVMDDVKTAKAIGWPIRKVQRERLKLIKAGWVYKQVYTSSIGPFHLTILGKELVRDYIAAHALDVTKDAGTMMTITDDELKEFEQVINDSEGKFIIKKGE